MPQNKKSWKRVQFAFFACLKFFPEGLHPAAKPEEVKASNTTNLCRRWQNAFPPPSFPQNPTIHSLQLLHLSFSSQHHSSTSREQLGENHCSCYLELKSSFPYNLLELSWHFPPPRLKRQEEGGACAYGVGGKAKHKPHKASYALLLHMQSTEKTIHVQRRGMNKFPNEETARKSKREEIRSAHTFPSLPTSGCEMGSKQWKEWERKHSETCAV